MLYTKIWLCSIYKKKRVVGTYKKYVRRWEIDFSLSIEVTLGKIWFCMRNASKGKISQNAHIFCVETIYLKYQKSGIETIYSIWQIAGKLVLWNINKILDRVYVCVCLYKYIVLALEEFCSTAGE